MSRMARAELVALCETEVTTTFTAACAAFGIAQSTGRELHHRGRFPVPVLRLGRLLKIRTADLRVALLDPDMSEAGPTSPAIATDATTPTEGGRHEEYPAPSVLPGNLRVARASRSSGGGPGSRAG